jgi:hypothetical protein
MVVRHLGSLFLISQKTALPRFTSCFLNTLNLHQPHSAVFGPAFLVVIAHDVFIVGVGIFGQVPLDEVFGFVLLEFKDNEKFVYVSAVHAYGVSHFRLDVFETHEIVRLLRGTRQVRGPAQAKCQKVQNQSVILENEGGKL